MNIIDFLGAMSFWPKKEYAKFLSEASYFEDEGIRCEVARNHLSSTEVLVRLAGDSSVNVRFNVAVNFNTPVEVLTTLSSDKVAMVRYAVARNPNTLEEDIIKLAKDKAWSVRETAKKTLAERGKKEEV